MLLVNNPSPMTLEDRGLAVPFTTPMLASCRLRRDYRDRLEILVPSLVDGRGLYVIPWAMLPEAAALTLHDRILHEEISKPTPLSPRSIREAGLQVAESGLAGTQAAEAARLTRERDAAETAAMKVRLEQMAAEATRRTSRRKWLPGESTTPRGPGAPAIGPSERHAAALSTIGLHDAAVPGRLRQTAADITDFFVAVDHWADPDEVDEAKLARFCGEVANHTRERCSVYFSEFDHLAERLARDADSWPQALDALEHIADRVSWLLDGWNFPVEWWRGSRAENRDMQSLALLGIFRILPLMPVSEAIRPAAKHRIRMGAVQRRWARLLEDWQTGQDDTELIVRIEKFRAQVA